MNKWRKGVERLQREGWTQGRYINGEGKLCFLGAVPVKFDKDNELLKEVIGEYEQVAVPLSYRVGTNEIVVDVVAWNDREDRTKEDVIAVMEKIAARSEEMGL